MCSHFLLQWIFLTQGSNWGLPPCRQILYYLSHQGSYRTYKVPANSLVQLLSCLSQSPHSLFTMPSSAWSLGRACGLLHPPCSPLRSSLDLHSIIQDLEETHISGTPSQASLLGHFSPLPVPFFVLLVDFILLIEFTYLKFVRLYIFWPSPPAAV